MTAATPGGGFLRREAAAARETVAVLRAAAHAHPDQRLLLLVGGPPASGKTSVADVLAARARCVALHKDRFKEPLMTELGVGTVEDSATLGRAAVIALFTAADAVLSTGAGVLLESTFNADDVERITDLQRAHGCAMLQIHVTAPVDVLVERWQSRAGSRHPGHLDQLRLPELRQRVEAGTWAPLPLETPLLVIDTSADTDERGFDVAAWLDGLRRSLPAAATR